MTKVISSVAAARTFREHNRHRRIALVATMGNLHNGHLSLLKIAQSHADLIVVSIFINPTQFAQDEDFSHYPRTFAADKTKLEAMGVDAVFHPDSAAIYPDDSDHTLSIQLPPALSAILCGKSRPTHFQGVATVIAKLLQIIRPDTAVFGEKDYQQLVIIRKLVDELFIDTDIIGAPIIRERNGLAMSSRNQYLSDREKQRASHLYRTLKTCRAQLRTEKSVDSVLTHGKQNLSQQGIAVDYLELRNKHSLQTASTVKDSILLIAAYIGKTRLIDNLLV